MGKKGFIRNDPNRLRSAYHQSSTQKGVAKIQDRNRQYCNGYQHSFEFSQYLRIEADSQYWMNAGCYERDLKKNGDKAIWCVPVATPSEDCTRMSYPQSTP